MLNLWVSPDFRLFSFFEDEYWQEFFLRFCPDIKKIWEERKLSCDESTRPRQMKYHTAINITGDSWRCNLIRCVSAVRVKDLIRCFTRFSPLQLLVVRIDQTVEEFMKADVCALLELSKQHSPSIKPIKSGKTLDVYKHSLDIYKHVSPSQTDMSTRKASK